MPKKRFYVIDIKMAKNKKKVTKRKSTTNKEKKLKEEIKDKDNLGKEKIKDEKIFAKGYCLKKIFIFSSLVVYLVLIMKKY